MDRGKQDADFVSDACLRELAADELMRWTSDYRGPRAWWTGESDWAWPRPQQTEDERRRMWAQVHADHAEFEAIRERVRAEVARLHMDEADRMLAEIERLRQEFSRLRDVGADAGIVEEDGDG